MGRCDGHPENCDNVDPVLHNDDEENDEDRTVYSDNTVIPTSYSILASSSGVHEHEDIDNIVHLYEMEADCDDTWKGLHSLPSAA